MTLKEIARKCETSVSTVSRVLNNNSPSCASEELKNRIWQVAQSMAYTPNAHARNLKKGLGQTQPLQIAVVLARIHALEDDPFFSELYRCIEIELCTQGCLLTTHNLGLLPEISVYKNKPDGIIILGRCSASLLQKLRSITHNLVCISRNPLDFQVDEVVCSGQKAARMALEYLIALGHRKIAYIGDCSYEERYTGYCETLIDHHLPLDYHAVFPTNQTQAAGFAAMNKLLQKTDISAVLCANDATAIGALEALAASHQRHRLSLISIDNISAAQQTSPLLSTVNIPREDMAHMAVALLLDRIHGHHKEFTRIELPCRIIKRESCLNVE